MEISIETEPANIKYTKNKKIKKTKKTKNVNKKEPLPTNLIVSDDKKQPKYSVIKELYSKLTIKNLIKPMYIQKKYFKHHRDTILELANIVYVNLGPGYCEGVYQEALLFELRSKGYKVSSEITVPIMYKGNPLSGNHSNRIDIVVQLQDGPKIILELKATTGKISKEHIIQLKRYLKSCKNCHWGVIINFPNKDFKPNTSLVKKNLVSMKTIFYRY